MGKLFGYGYCVKIFLKIYPYQWKHFPFLCNEISGFVIHLNFVPKASKFNLKIDSWKAHFLELRTSRYRLLRVTLPSLSLKRRFTLPFSPLGTYQSEFSQIPGIFGIEVMSCIVFGHLSLVSHLFALLQVLDIIVLINSMHSPVLVSAILKMRKETVTYVTVLSGGAVMRW